MLADISIANLGVITSASAELADGLTVLTGETGAGKTMVVTGLRLLTGGRADASRVRTGSDQALVEGHFTVHTMGEPTRQALTALAEEAGVSTDENGEYLASRTVSAKGRSRAHLGGRSVPAATMQEFTSHLLTIHGQNDQLRLTSPDEQLAALDRFDPAIPPILAAYREAYRTWRGLAKDLRERTGKRRELAQEVDRLGFAIGEIDEIAPKDNEDVELVEQIRRLQDVDTLREAATLALGAIDGAEALGGYDDEGDPASTLLGQAHSALAGNEDPELREQAATLAEVISQLSDVTGTLGRFLADLDADPQALEKMLQRQQELKSLTRKYASDIDGVIAWRTKAAKRLAKIDTSTEALDKLTAQVAAAEKTMKAAAKKLSAARAKAATTLGEQVTQELRGLAMPKARLEVAVDRTQPGPEGADQVELRLAPNDAMAARPLASSASGGELSRVMLALEVILSSGSRGTTMVFDEVDAGVGGRAAVEIGRRLARLATHNQVIVVTHLPQVAAYADTHLHVAKEVGDATVTSGVRSLSDEERIEELARMLAGLDDTETGRAHATELLHRAQEEVEAMR
ncbi:DNA repair protein RecN [Corynebacterium guangdongense]|uniref:DNA repair protein RecN n=1 Tax=Corynebacterium guangdongense TaxID=1783348 RepID=A0ABU1ZWF7_9CORY|nr:DNA repair protein RecN [Corynebacterium guangdongense]MDR7329273.1 DNA repair protein RecN (Recombination protein N) [Corynebacterium guangdongense]WJZ17839.1 DNA repair protein RecN [Corynebacterium guangdongense]